MGAEVEVHSEVTMFVSTESGDNRSVNGISVEETASTPSSPSEAVNIADDPSSIKVQKAILIQEISQLRSELAQVKAEIEAETRRLTKDNRARLTPEEERRQNLMALGRKKFNISPQKGIEFLVEQGILENTSESISKFLLDCEFLSKATIGEYLGEGKSFNIEVLEKYISAQDFTNLSFDAALRKFLSGFRLPGEAQKIDRMMERFAQRYCGNNPEIFANPDTAYVLAFSLIMLNTDLHNPNVKNKISRAGFLKNNKGINDGKDLPEKLLLGLYDNILKDEIKMSDEGNVDAAYTFFNPEREGYLVKQGGRIKTWKRRWCILTGSCLYYFKDPGDREPCGIIPLENLYVRDVASSSKAKFLFELAAASDEVGAKPGQKSIKAAKTASDGKFVEGHHNNYLFQAETEDEKMDWMCSIKANMSKPPIYTLLQLKKQKVTHAADYNGNESDGSN